LGRAICRAHPHREGFVSSDVMIFTETKLKGVFVVIPQFLRDGRGFFARSYCRNEFEGHGLDPRLVQCNISFNRLKGTLRGMHYQAHPYGEAKLVRCVSGALCDVIIDLRPDSPTYLHWISVELRSPVLRDAKDEEDVENYKMLYVPEGIAHGFQTLEDNTEVLYQMSEFYHPESARGVRWNDPAFGIVWPIANPIVSPKDAAYPDFER
jgi:dTDP-4-dehydrorhamnose 3,5-epimerase